MACPLGDDRRTATVVADRHPLVVGQQGIVRAEQAADGRRVMDAGVEVRVVADHAGQRELGIGLRHEARGEPRRLPGITAQRARQRRTQQTPLRRGPCHQVTQVARGERRKQRGDLGVPGAIDRRAGEIQHLIADGDADAPRLPAAGAAEAPVRQILEREIRVGTVGRFDPAAQCRVVRAVERDHAALSRRRGSKCFFSPCQQR